MKPCGCRKNLILIALSAMEQEIFWMQKALLPIPGIIKGKSAWTRLHACKKCRLHLRSLSKSQKPINPEAIQTQTINCKPRSSLCWRETHLPGVSSWVKHFRTETEPAKR